mmetsp:Transcript_100375/g.181167  ORF Transcript_100375/g.181167 Transcript_100375/m.181167 type:complete len:186 (+) Transcript_100375:391-948(+)
MLGPQLPGVAMASILRLPNIGAEPVARWRFIPDGQGAKPDWSFMLPNVLESFWKEAKVTGTPSRRPDVGWSVTYKSPTASAKRNLTERSVTLAWLGGEVWQDGSGGFLSAEWLRQTDELVAEGEGVGDYKVLMALHQGDKGQGPVTGLMRVAGFLQPLDSKYIEANGQAVAVYDYTLTLTPDVKA